MGSSRAQQLSDAFSLCLTKPDDIVTNQRDRPDPSSLACAPLYRDALGPDHLGTVTTLYRLASLTGRVY